MAATLKATIELEGAQQILRQLEGLGKAGEKAFVDIKNSADRVGGFQNLKTDEVRQKLNAVGLTGEAAFNRIRNAVDTAVRVERVLNALTAIQNGFAGVGNAALGLLRVLGPLGLVLGAVGGAAAAAAFGITKLAESHAKAALASDATAQKLGLTIAQYERLRGAANNAGISTESLNSGLQKLKGQVDAAGGAQFKAYADEVVRLRAAGQTSAQALNVLQSAAAGTGEKAKIAQEALKQIGTAAGSSAKQITTATTPIKSVGDELVATAQKLQALPDSAARTQTAIDALGDALGTRLIQALRSGPEAVARLIDEIRTGTGGLTQDQINNASRIETAWTRVRERIAEIGRSPPPQFVSDSAIAILNAVHESLVRIQTFLQDPSWANFGAIFEPGWELIKQGASAAFDFVNTKAQEVSLAITQMVTAPVANAWQWIATTFQSVLDQVLAKARAVWAEIVRLFTQSPDRGGASVTGEGTGAEGLARGGLIGGRGTGTSDSNLAWVSRGEYVMPEGATSKPGMRSLLDELRRTGGDWRRVMERFRGYNLGGIVGDVVGSLSPTRAMPIPALAGGGSVSGDNIFLQFGGETLGPMHATADVVDQLRKAAVLSQTRSAGPKPSRY